MSGPAPEATTTTVAVAGGELTVARWGEGAPTVLAVHGGTCSHLAWAPVVGHLVPGLTVLAPDVRGAASGSALPPPYGMAAHADDLVRVLDAAHVDRCTITGWSLGGFIAAATARRHPDRFDAVVLVDGGVAQPLPDGIPPDAVVEQLVEPALAQLTTTHPTADSYVEACRAHPAYAGPGAWNEALERHARYGTVEVDGRYGAWTNLAAMRADVADTLVDPDTRRAALELDAPTTFVRVERGVVDEPEGYYSWRGFEELLAEHGIELVDVPGLNHWTLMFSDAGAAVVAHAVRRAASARA